MENHSLLLHLGPVKSRCPLWKPDESAMLGRKGFSTMRILALETTEKTGGVAALDDYNLLAELNLDQTQRSAQSFAPAIHALIEQVGWLPRDVQLLGVAVGPGSFTGLRVGVTAAKVFAYAVGAQVLGVSTLEAIAAAAPDDIAEFSTVMDALRGDLVVQSFARQPDGSREPLGPQELVSAHAWLARLTPGTVVTGPGLAKLADRLPSGVTALDPRLWPPTAVAVGRLACRYHGMGRCDDLWKLVPRYCRRSAAEEKWDARNRVAQPPSAVPDRAESPSTAEGGCAT
jgi:tRNA threonylcarbamoyladenosine biosynthesis protein TsaB